jgi:NAD(P)-dependent dehydrogenase (short-subunit alcohol dehydrogenase family)
MNKVAVVTGAQGGIGRYLVREYLDAGYTVVGIDRVGDVDIKQDDYYFFNIDLANVVSDEQEKNSFQAKFEGVVGSRNPRVTLINNAALQVVKPVEQLSVEDMTQTFAVNAIGPTIMFQILLPRLRASRGAVLNICSIHTRLTKPDFSIYAASKSALESMTRSWAIEYAKEGVAINALSPAAIDTLMLREGLSGNASLLPQLRECHPAGFIGDPKKVAALARRITEFEDSFLAGSVIDYSGAISSRLHDPQ